MFRITAVCGHKERVQGTGCQAVPRHTHATTKVVRTTQNVAPPPPPPPPPPPLHPPHKAKQKKKKNRKKKKQIRVWLELTSVLCAEAPLAVRASCALQWRVRRQQLACSPPVLDAWPPWSSQPVVPVGFLRGPTCSPHRCPPPRCRFHLRHPPPASSASSPGQEQWTAGCRCRRSR